MKRLIYAFIIHIIITFLCRTAMATNGYQLIGVGQAQKSMGGAVTAAPMDTMTAISNPAGMARVGERADFSMDAFMPVRYVDFSANGGEYTKGGTGLYGIPSVGWVAKAFGRDNVYFGGGMFATSGLGVDYAQITMMPAAPPNIPNDVTFNGYSGIQFWKMAPTVAWNVSGMPVSAGISLNVDYMSVTIRQKFQNVPFWTTPGGPSGTPVPSDITQMDVNFDLGRPTNQIGYGASAGILYDLDKLITIGASYTSKQFFGDSTYRIGKDDIKNFNGATGDQGVYRMDLDFPQQAAIGIAVRPNDKFLVDFDVKWINWSDTHDKVTFKGPSNSFDTDSTAGGDSSSTKLNFGWDDQYIYALGIQYKASPKLNIRAGYNYGKSPLNKRDVFNNLIFPAVVERHTTIGFDYQLGEHWGIGLTYMKAANKTLTGKRDVPPGFDYMTPFEANSDIKISLEETSLGMLLSYRFN
ncbi:MAG: outer membrane protein transport protein [Nitrospirae bacterium]|nr:outer membrane protein transport protein [Nitrospirota bacterium]